MHINEADIYSMWGEQTRTEAHSSYEILYPSIFMSHIHERNFQTLRSTLQTYESIEFMQKNLEEKSVTRNDFLIVTGLFVNYMASAITLKESTRNITRKPELFTLELEQESKQRIESEIKPNAVIKLVEELRNIISHQSLIIPTLSFTFKKNSFKAGYAYQVKKLLPNTRLTSSSKEYIAQLNNEYLYLRPLIDIYHQTASSYQNWLLNAALNKHKEDNPLYWEVRSQISFEWDGDLTPITPANDNSQINVE